MRTREFMESLAHPVCPSGLDPCAQALWHAAQDNWHAAHDIVQSIDSPVAARIHAWLHRKEGDDRNARYWHRQAGTEFPAHLDIEEEWAELVRILLD